MAAEGVDTHAWNGYNDPIPKKMPYQPNKNKRMLATYRVIDRKFPTYSQTVTRDFPDKQALDNYVTDLRKMRYKVKVMDRQPEQWEYLALANKEPWATDRKN